MERLFLLLAFLALPSFAAFDFKTADAFFAQRENSVEKITQARKIYRKALNEAHSDETVYAMDQLGKLAYYEGELLTAEDNHDKRVEIFQQCQDDVEKISPARLKKEVPTYYYWKAACIALWGKSASSFKVPGRLGSLEEAMNKGLALDARFAGGGMHRVMGSVYLKSKSLWWIPGLSRFYNPQKALTHIEAATLVGPEYFVSFLTKAEVLRELDRKEEGLKLLKDKKEELEQRVRANRLPVGLEPESKVILRQMVSLITNW